jgi:hypothetical protein
MLRGNGIRRFAQIKLSQPSNFLSRWANKANNSTVAAHHFPNATAPAISLFLSPSSPKINAPIGEPRSQSNSLQLLGPRLPVLEEAYRYLITRPDKPDFSRTLFVCGEHLLETTVSLLEMYIRLGAKPENIYVVGKSYSNNADVIQQLHRLKINHVPNNEQDTLGSFSIGYDGDIAEMLKRVTNRFKNPSKRSKIDGVIVADDGGHVLEKIHHTKAFRTLFKYVVGIEQTSSGIIASKETPYPVIELATSATKNLLEPKMVSSTIATIVKKKLASEWKTEYYPELAGTNFSQFFRYDHHNHRCGIIGVGSIGLAVLNSLIEIGYKKFLIYDANFNRASRIVKEYQERYPDLTIVNVHSGAAALYADVIAGCTGTDVTNDPHAMDVFAVSETPKILFSCASKDKEFLNLLKYIHSNRRNTTNPLDDIVFKNGFRAPLLILRGGFPLNFDNSLSSVPRHLIQVIRGIKLMAAFQAYKMLSDARNDTFACKNYQLNPELQKVVIDAFLEDQPDAAQRYCMEENIHKLKNIEEIRKLSGGFSYSMSHDTRELNLSPSSFKI